MELRKYGIATLLDPRYKFAGFRSRENATLAKERLIQEMTTANTATEEVQGNETPRTTFDTAWMQFSMKVGNQTALSRKKLTNCIGSNLTTI